MWLKIQKALYRIFGFIISVLLTVGGLLLMRREELLAGIIILALALALLLISVRSIEKNPLTEEEVNILKPYLFPVLFFITALVLAGLASFNVTEYPRTLGLNQLAAVEWLMSLLSLTMGVLWAAQWKPVRPRVIMSWIKANPVEFGLIAVIVVAGAIIRLAALTEHPYPWSGDEASIGMEARRLLNGDNSNLFNTGWSGQPNVSFVPTAIMMLLFGESFFAIKMVSVITGILGIVALYLLAREWFGREVALIASGYLVAYPVHLHFSRMGVHNIIDSLMVSLVLWLIYRAVRTKSMPTYLMAGIASGLTIYTYVGTRLVLAIGIGAIVYISLRRKGYLKSSLYHLAAYLSGLVVTVAPMATFFIKNPTLFMTRIGQEGILLSGWLARQVELTGQSTWQILLQQLSRTVLVFFAQDANGNFLNFNRPYLTILGAIFFMIGMAVSFRHVLDERHFVLQAWFWSVLALGGFLTVNPPANTRLVMTIPAVCLLIGLGAWQVSKVLLQLKFTPQLVYGLNAALVLILAFQDLSFYFGSYWKENRFQDANGEIGMEAGLRLQQLGSDYDLYLFGAPRVFAGFPTTDFLIPANLKVDLQADSIPGLSFTSGQGAYIAAIPENREMLQQVEQRYPGGTWETMERKVKDEVLYYAYILTPELTGTP
jgi:4-amino-4-deoxy-L-arabinose transferase-like glycosyltransferase